MKIFFKKTKGEIQKQEHPEVCPVHRKPPPYLAKHLDDKDGYPKEAARKAGKRFWKEIAALEATPLTEVQGGFEETPRDVQHSLLGNGKIPPRHRRNQSSRQGSSLSRSLAG